MATLINCTARLISGRLNLTFLNLLTGFPLLSQAGDAAFTFLAEREYFISNTNRVCHLNDVKINPHQVHSSAVIIHLMVKLEYQKILPFKFRG
ncbi:MAG: hypothetical protein LBP22_09995, partial [Deltaproteobacteria bacterium]|nr:hypothetical protein [Deltaproteobacteria bacterium]